MSTVFPYQKSMCTHAIKHATNRVGKTIPKNCHILGNVLEISRFPSPISRFLSPKIRFSSHGIQFTQIGFLLSSTAFRFLQQLSDFLQRLSACSNGFPISLNRFPLSEKSKKIYLWQEVYKRLLFKLCIFCHLLPELCNFR